MIGRASHDVVVSRMISIEQGTGRAVDAAISLFRVVALERGRYPDKVISVAAGVAGAREYGRHRAWRLLAQLVGDSVIVVEFFSTYHHAGHLHALGELVALGMVKRKGALEIAGELPGQFLHIAGFVLQ